MEFIFNLLRPLMWAESWVMVGWHNLAEIVGIGGGWAWAIGIIGLTLVVRMILIPLFVKQIHASRKMQLIQPELQKIQAKYKDKKDPESRQAMTQETMEFYKRTGTNPFSSCLPILLQMPFFFALFQLLNNIKGLAEGKADVLRSFPDGIGAISRDVAHKFEDSMIFGSKLSDSFVFGTSMQTKVLTAVLIVLMSVTTFTTQHQLMLKNMPKAALESPFAKQQKILVYVMPFFFAFSGINFPVGVLLYWLTTNLWTMFQQFYVIRRMPAPGSAAEKAMQERQRRRGKDVVQFTVPGLGEATVVEESERPRQRQQPMSKKRQKSKGARPAGNPQGHVGELADEVVESVEGESDGSAANSAASAGTGAGSAPRKGKGPASSPRPQGATRPENRPGKGVASPTKQNPTRKRGKRP